MRSTRVVSASNGPKMVGVPSAIPNLLREMTMPSNSSAPIRPAAGGPARGFTLVELLVVIAVIGILVALLLPAVQAAREAARRTQCQNHLRQIALAVELYHGVKRQFPPARIGTRFHPSGTDQYAVSWAFLLLPWLEEQALHDRFVADERVDAMANAPAMRTPVSVYFCPSQRGPVANRDFDNDEAPSLVRGVATAGDYAANSGTSTQHGMPGRDRLNPKEMGPIYTLSRIKGRQVKDGFSKTYSVGEKYLPPPRDDVPDGLQHLAQGDVAYFSGDARHTIVRRSSAGFPDGPGDRYPGQFGSRHQGISHFAFLDGSIQVIEHEIDTGILMMLSAIGDGGRIPDGILDD